MCILVLGMHRSGTSAFARVLSLLGCDLPKTLMEANWSNESGHWESDVIRYLNERILESAGSNWDDWLEVNPGWLQSPKAEEYREEAVELLRQEFGSSRLFVLKDPRICRLLPFWLGVLDDVGARPLVVSPVRNPLEVAASLQARDDSEVELGHLLWLRHVLDGEFASRGLPRFYTSYDRLISGWARTAEDARSTLGITWPRMSDKAAGEIEAFLSKTYRHHQQPIEAILENPILSDWMRTTFEILGNWSVAGENEDDFEALDRIRAALNGAAPAFSRLLSAEHGKAARLKSELGAERQRLAETQQQFAETQAKLETAEEAVAAERERSAKLAAELSSERQRLAEAGERYGHAQAKLQAAEEAAAAERERVGRLTSELQARAQAAEEAEKSLRETRHRLAQTESALAQRRHEAEQTAAELAAAREELRQSAAARAGAEKVSAGLKEHVLLLIADMKERQAEAAANEKAVAAVAREVKQVLAVLETSRDELATRLDAQLQETARARREAEEQAAEAERVRLEQIAELEARVVQRTEESEVLARLLDERQAEAHHVRLEAERFRQEAAGVIGRAVAGLLNGHGSGLQWRPFRLSRHIALVKRSGVFDSEWYLREYTDVAASGMDPLLHYIRYGLKEGRAPNPALKPLNGVAQAASPARTAPEPEPAPADAAQA